MQAVILAGGLGTRLRPLTEQIPKVMVPVSGKPFLSHLLDLLRSQGVRDIVLCIGYLGKQVRDFLGNGGSLGITLRYSEEKERLLGTGGALKQARSLLAEVEPFEPEAMEPPMRALAEELGLKAGQLFGVVRWAVTGQKVAPPLFGSLVVLGREQVLARLDAAEAVLTAST